MGPVLQALAATTLRTLAVIALVLALVVAVGYFVVERGPEHLEEAGDDRERRPLVGVLAPAGLEEVPDLDGPARRNLRLHLALDYPVHHLVGPHLGEGRLLRQHLLLP